MRPNVFLRSTLRQPIRTALLFLIIVLIAFAFVSQGAQFLLIKQETEELEAYYCSVGTLSAGSAAADMAADVSEAAAYLEENRYVKDIDRVQLVSAVADVQNVDTYRANPNHMNADIYFYGTLRTIAREIPDPSGNGAPVYAFEFEVDTVLAGYEEYLWEGMTAVLMSPWGDGEQYINGGLLLQYYYSMTPGGRERIPAEELVAPYADLNRVYKGFRRGGRYLVHAVYEEAGSKRNSLYDPDMGWASFTIRPLTEDGLWYYPVEKGEEADFSDPVLAGVAEDIRLVNDNQNALLFFGSKDVSAMPETRKDPENAPVLTNALLVEGRWPDARDNAEGNRVCAIHAKLAEVRGLSVGDTLTVSFRELLDMSGAPYLCMPDDLERTDTMDATGAEAFEIVGIFETNTPDKYYYNYLYNFVYAPASALPQSFADASGAWSPYLFSFTLASPEYENQFYVETRDALADMGFRVWFLQTNYAGFRAAAGPILRAALFNLLIFTAVFATALCLTVFLYIRMHRKDLAIARALGVPAGRCVRQMSVPLLLIHLPGILTGGCLGWWYTAANAGRTLSSLSELMEENGAEAAAQSAGWLFLLLAAGVVLLLALTLGGIIPMARKPVLVQLQGGAAGGRRTSAPVRRGPVDAAPARLELAAVRTASSAPAPGGGIGAAMTLRFVWRHISRARLKTVLSALLAAVFTVSLAAIRLSIADGEERIDRLYSETVVEADLLNARSNYALLTNGYIRDDALQAILDTGYVASASPEGVRQVTVYLIDQATQKNNKILSWDIRSFEREDTFLSFSGGGSSVTITYLDGWDGGLFAADWQDREGPVPAVLPLELYEAYQIQPGDLLAISCGSLRTFTAAGYYSGTVADTSDGSAEPVLIPLSAHRAMLNNKGIFYARVRLSLDPSVNRQLDQAEAAVQETASQKSAVRLQAVFWDQELRAAAAPLENNVALMRELYPVISTLSLLSAAGIAALFVMTAAKEAAILRVQGTSKLRSRIMLSLQQAFPAVAGLAVGTLAALAWSQAARPELLAELAEASALCAILYLLAAVLGAAASSVAVTGKNPLELLQVKE